jgi:hypothetical protein
MSTYHIIIKNLWKIEKLLRPVRVSLNLTCKLLCGRIFTKMSRASSRSWGSGAISVNKYDASSHRAMHRTVLPTPWPPQARVAQAEEHGTFMDWSTGRVGGRRQPCTLPWGRAGGWARRSPRLGSRETVKRAEQHGIIYRRPWWTPSGATRVLPVMAGGVVPFFLRKVLVYIRKQMRRRPRKNA